MSLAELAIALAPAWGAGLRAYAVIFAVGPAGPVARDRTSARFLGAARRLPDCGG
jgi:hypothetical protein